MENTIEENSGNIFNFKDFLNKFLSKWKWFVICVFITVTLAYIKLKYTLPTFESKSIVLLKDENKGNLISEMASFVDPSRASGLKSNIENEIEILRSRTLIEETVKKLSLNISLVVKGKLVNIELYKKPILVNFVEKSEDFYQKGMVFKYYPISSKKFRLEEDVLESDSKIITSNKNDFYYGELVNTRFGKFIVTKSPEKLDKSAKINYPIYITISPLKNVVNNFKSNLLVKLFNTKSSVVQISYINPVKKRSEDFINELFYLYNQNAIEKKNIIFENTSKFISNRLKIITEELGGVEKEVENFKIANNLTDIDSEAKLYLQGSSDYNKKVVDTEVKINIVNSVRDYLRKSSGLDLLPTNVLTFDADASRLISNYNDLVLDRNRISKSATDTNPTVSKINQRISSIRSTIEASLDRLKTSLIIEKTSLNDSENNLKSKISKVPSQERIYKVIARQQKVKEELYLFLLQKREETAISLAAKDPMGIVIDQADTSEIPVSPVKMNYFIIALLLGVAIPFLIIYIRDILDTKVKSSIDILGKIKVPFLGNIPKSSSTEGKLISATSRSSTDEALRIVRTNIDFVVSDVDSSLAKTIFSTSTVPGEGKTFISANLASTFALLGKKVLLIGMDIRKPRLDEYFTIPNRGKGVTNYLSTPDADVHDYLIKQDGYDCFYVFPSGVVPPNPADLLSKDKVNTMFEILKKEFDYIIVDTAPVGPVVDTLLVAKHADAFIYVVKANQLDKSMLKLPEKLYLEKKLPNMAIVLNYTEIGNGYGYGYGYGYGVEEEKISWFRKVLNKFKK